MRSAESSLHIPHSALRIQITVAWAALALHQTSLASFVASLDFRLQVELQTLINCRNSHLLARRILIQQDFYTINRVHVLFG